MVFGNGSELLKGNRNQKRVVICKFLQQDNEKNPQEVTFSSPIQKRKEKKAWKETREEEGRDDREEISELCKIANDE